MVTHYTSTRNDSTNKSDFIFRKNNLVIIIIIDIYIIQIYIKITTK